MIKLLWDTLDLLFTSQLQTRSLGGVWSAIQAKSITMELQAFLRTCVCTETELQEPLILGFLREGADDKEDVMPQ